MNKIKNCLWLLCVSLIMVGCEREIYNQDDEQPHQDDEQPLKINLSNNLIQAGCRYYTLRFEMNDLTPEDVVLDLECDAEWLTLTCDTLHPDGVLDVFADANPTRSKRTANIFITSRRHTNRQAVIEVVQNAMKTSVGGAEDPALTFDLGYGFSVFDEYQSHNSIKSKIINVDALDKYSTDSTFNIIQENLRGKDEIEYLAGYSLAELSYKMTEKSTSSTSFLGYRKTTTRYNEIQKEETCEQSFGYGRMSKIVASRSMDVGALTYLVRHSEAMPKTKLFTSTFNQTYSSILRENNTANREKIIQGMLDEFGTHVVVRASLGGYIDYCFTLDETTVENLESSVSCETNKVFGKGGSSSSSSYSYDITSSKSSHQAFTVVGGSDEAKEALQQEISCMSEDGAFSNNTLQTWLHSISSDNLKSSDRYKNLGVVDFHFIPIWELFPTEIAHQIIASVMARSNDIGNEFSDKEIGIDLYHIDLKNSDFLNFKNSKDATLVKVIYNAKDGVPICEVCNEYVPKIRSDRRVTVLYPIKDGRTQQTQGLFIGDGEGNRPATLSFSNGDVYVNPISEFDVNDVLTSAYYVHGNLYALDYSLPFQSKTSFECRDHYLQFYDKSGPKYPVVKIGNGYWTRCPMKEEMYWGYYEYESDYELTPRETIHNGILYAQTFDYQDPLFFALNGDIYDFQINKTLGMRDKWYVPSTLDRNNMIKYLGNNHKVLFTGQQSGFEADFSGCYGWVDPFDPSIEYEDKYGDPTQKFVYEGEYCFISFRDVSNSDTYLVKGATLLVLGKDYTWKEVTLPQNSDFAYPVRLFRTAAFYYKKIK